MDEKRVNRKKKKILQLER